MNSLLRRTHWLCVYSALLWNVQANTLISWRHTYWEVATENLCLFFSKFTSRTTKWTSGYLSTQGFSASQYLFLIHRFVYSSFPFSGDLWTLPSVVPFSSHRSWAVACSYPFFFSHRLLYFPGISLFFFISYFLLPLLYLPLCDPRATDSSIKGRGEAVCVCVCHPDPSSVDALISFFTSLCGSGL